MAIEHEIDSPFAEAVRSIGSQSATARVVRKSQSTIYARLKSGKPVWAEDVLAVSEASGIPKERLRPDLYPRASPDAAATAMAPVR